MSNKSSSKTIFSLDDNGHVQSLDFLKAFSIFTIVVMHMVQSYIEGINGLVVTASSLGGTGAHMFLFASGFGLYLSYLKHKTSFLEFVKRRLWKIYVPYIIIVIISFFLPWMYYEQDRVQALLSHIFLYKMFIPRYEESLGAQLWYISTLFQLYLLFIPLCKLREKVSGKYFITGAFIISMCYSFFIVATGLSSERIFNSSCIQFIWEFCLGMEIARLLKSGKKLELSTLQLFIIAIIGLGMDGLIAIKIPSFKAFNDIFASFGYMAVALLLYRLFGNATKKLWKDFCKYSYEWYLVHMAVFSTMWLIAPNGLNKQLLFGIFVILISYYVAVVYWYLVHRVIRV
ncbi:MAG: acyltransferase [Ligilactobacillus sp.]|nr:acyltransferase [Ligilactobacillus sp.]